MILRIFHSFPIFLELTLHRKKTLFSIFWCFRDPNDVQMTWKFTSISFWKERSVGAKEANKQRPEGQDRVAHAARFLGRVGSSLFPLVAPMSSIFSPPAGSWPKHSYIKGHLARRAPPKHRNHEIETWSCRLEGENSGGALPAWSPSYPTTSLPSPWWRGNGPPLDYGFVEVTYVSPLSWASLISTVWAAEHDYGHLCNTFVVDLFMS